MSNSTWKDGEYDYCRSLVLGGGPTKEVPREAVFSYLKLQHDCAARDKRFDVSGDIALLMKIWECRNAK